MASNLEKVICSNFPPPPINLEFVLNSRQQIPPDPPKKNFNITAKHNGRDKEHYPREYAFKSNERPPRVHWPRLGTDQSSGSPNLFNQSSEYFRRWMAVTTGDPVLKVRQPRNPSVIPQHLPSYSSKISGDTLRGTWSMYFVPPSTLLRVAGLPSLHHTSAVNVHSYRRDSRPIRCRVVRKKTH